MNTERLSYFQQVLDVGGAHYVNIGALGVPDEVGETSQERFRSERTHVQISTTEELQKQFFLAFPLCLANISRFAIPFVAVAFLGHVGSEELAAAALAISFSNGTLLSVMIGIASALDTLCTQAFGAGEFAQMSYACQRTLLVQVAFLIPLGVLNWEMETVLLFLGQAPSLAAKAAPYTRILVIAALFQGMTQNVQRFLQAQGLTRAVLWSALTAVVFHMGACWFLVRHLGYLGAPLAITLSNLVMLTTLSLAVAKSPAAQYHPGWSAKVFKDWGPVLKLALPSLAMMSVEWWIDEFMILLAGRLDRPALKVDTAVVCLSVLQLSYAAPYGLAATASTRVGNELGAEHQEHQSGKGVKSGLSIGQEKRATHANSGIQ